MNSPFTDFTGTLNEERDVEKFSTDTLINTPFQETDNYYETENGYQPVQVDNYDYIGDMNLSSAQVIKGVKLNEDFMKDPTVSPTGLGWAKFIPQIQKQFVQMGMMPDNPNFNLATAPELFVSLISEYQTKKNLVPTDRGAMAIGTWSAMQDDLKLIKISEPRITVTDHIRAANLRYSEREHWKEYKQRILDHLASPAMGILTAGLPIDTVYFALAVSEWQKRKGFSGKDVDGILGPFSWKILFADLMIGNTDIFYNVNITNTAAAAKKFAQLMNDLEHQLYTQFMYIQSAIFVNMDIDENAGGVDTTSIGLSTFFSLIGAIENPWLQVGSAIANGLLDYYKEYQEKKQKSASLAAKLKLVDIINQLQKSTWFNTDEKLIQIKLDEQLAIAKRNGADYQTEFNKFLKYLEDLEVVVQDKKNEVLQSAISSLIGSISKHTRIIINSDNTELLMSDWDTDDIIEVSKRQQIKIKFSKVHPMVPVVDSEISTQESTILKFAWKVWQDKGYALKYLAVNKHIFFRAYPEVIYMPYRGNVYQYTINVFVKTLKPGENWVNVNDIEGRDNTNIFFENIYIMDGKAFDSGRSTRGINELNSKGRSFLKIILYVVNNVMTNSYNNPADVKKVERLEYESADLLHDQQHPNEELYNQESFNYYESAEEENQNIPGTLFQNNEWEDIDRETTEQLFSEFTVDPVKGTTDYLNVSAIKGRSLQTGVFIPASFTKSNNTDIVLYLHGMFEDGDKTNGIDSYWNTYSNIREYFYTSGKNAILLAPGLTKDPQNSSVFANGLDNFLNSCLAELKAKNYVLSTTVFNRIILAAHSAGGKPLGIILNSSSQYVNNIVECWGFDCLYADGWGKLINNWANGTKVFYHYWAWSCSAAHLDKCPKVIGERYQKINPSNFLSIGPGSKIIHHQQVIEDAWLNKINSRTWFSAGSIPAITPVPTAPSVNMPAAYLKMNLASLGLSLDAFRIACNGYKKMDQSGQLKNNRVLSIVDFTQSSKKRRLYILDMIDQRVLINTNVAHGHNGTKEWATKFSNTAGSKMSSLGFYLTQETFQGKKNGLSLRIKGLEKGFNDNARARAVIVHSAAYVHEDGDVGRSWGCAVVPPNRRDEVINTIKNGTCLFLYYTDADYLSKSLLAADSPTTSQENYFFNNEDANNSYELDEIDHLHENYEEESNAAAQFESEDPAPADTPSGNPVPFAPLPPTGSYWPIVTNVPEGRLVSYVTTGGTTIGNSSRKFLANRETSSGEPRYHVAIDLYAKFNDPVIACDDGKILSFNHFYTTSSGHATNSLVVQHSNVIINYGEVGPSSFGRLNLHVGDTVKAGQVIAFIGATEMLHFEVYKIIDGTRDLPPHRWMKTDANPPAALYNPTKYILYLKQYGLTGAVNAPASSTAPSPAAPATTGQWSNATRLNRYYADKLGWNQFYDKINDFLLPFAGQQNVSLGEDAFAEAVSIWQRSLGFAAKDCDGVIGPVSWKRLSALLQGPVAGSTIPASSAGINTIEAIPATFTSDKVPAGFKESSYSVWRGLNRNSVMKVDEAAKKINTVISLSNYGITETDIDTFQRLANAETNGHIQNFYSLDMAIVSIGFRQFTFIHGNIHSWIEKAPAAFKRYGIEIDYALPPYVIKRSKGNYTVKRIKGVDDPETLRWNGWAQRFYYAGLDYEIIVAEFVLAKEYFAKELTRLKSYLKDDASFSKFNSYYNQSAHVRAFFHELNNAAPAYVPSLTSKALAKTAAGESIDRFFAIYLQTAKENWPDAAQVQRIYDHTSAGATIKVFENEFIYGEATEEDGSSYDNEFIYGEATEEDGSSYDELSRYETGLEEFRPAHYSDEINSFTKDWSNAIRQNNYYSNQLGWAQYYDQINNLLLPFSGQQNVSLGEEAFANAVSAWQQQQGFSAAQSDGIIGPHTWSAMQPLLNTVVPQQPVVPAPAGPVPPPVQNVLAFNQWHAQKILDNINAGIVSVNTHVKFNPKTQLENIVKGIVVLNVNPVNTIVKILPVIYQISEQAKMNNYRKVVIGSFIREADANGNCTGHCAGRCIDLNYSGGSWELPGPDVMVKNILNWLIPLNNLQNQHFGFGMPLQGNFFGHRNYVKYRSQPASNIIDPGISMLVPQLGIVFPDNDNHLHIQVS